MPGSSQDRSFGFKSRQQKLMPYWRRFRKYTARLSWWHVAMLVSPLVLWFLATTYRSSRLKGLPDVPDPFDIHSASEMEFDPVLDAFEHYRKAVAALVPLSSENQVELQAAMQRGWSGAPEWLRKWRHDNEGALQEFRLGSELPFAYYYQPGELTLTSDFSVGHRLHDLMELSRLETLRLLEGGDVRSAWSACRSAVRCSRQVGRYGGIDERLIGMSLYRGMIPTILLWASSPQLKEGTLMVAVNDLKAMRRTTAIPSDNLRAEYLAFRRAMINPDSVAEPLEYLVGGSGWSTTSVGLYFAGEPEISRRVLKLAWTNWLSQCDRTSPHRGAVLPGKLSLFLPLGNEPAATRRIGTEEIEDWFRRTVLADALMPNVSRFLAAHDTELAWQTLVETAVMLQYRRRQTKSLEAAVQRLTVQFKSDLPADPFALEGPLRIRIEPDLPETATLWSIGPDHIDDDGLVEVPEGGTKGDLVLHIRGTPPQRLQR
ncbi:MAG: hypothetical protein ACKV0T_24595 [Planctomycetales bacterium]